MPVKAIIPIPSGVQDSNAAKKAFSDYAELVLVHARDAARWDDEDRVAERRASHAAFLAAFRGVQ